MVFGFISKDDNPWKKEAPVKLKCCFRCFRRQNPMASGSGAAKIRSIADNGTITGQRRI